MDFVVFIVVGLIAGSLASRVVTGKGKGCLMDIIIGILGAVIGGWLAGLAHISVGFGILGEIVVAFVGAVILIVAWRAIVGRKRKS